jgi:hypothetical protein
MPAVLTLRGSRLVLASGVWLTIYVFCMLMVASFIFFEVLDVDGSDFPAYPGRMDARLAEAHHDDLKRLWQPQPLKVWTEAGTIDPPQPERPEADVRAVTSPRQPIRRHRAALPRAALLDPASA